MSMLQVVAVIVILGVMVLILLGISHIFSGSFNTDQNDEAALRQDLEDKPDVITEENVFHQLLRDENSFKKSSAATANSETHS